MSCCFWFFFFKQKTAYEMRISDWSSDVCSSDLAQPDHGGKRCGDIAELVGAQREDRGNRLVEQAAGGGANLCGLSEQSRRGVSRSGRDGAIAVRGRQPRSEEHTSELQSLMRISYAVFCLKKKKTTQNNQKPQTR